MAETVYSIPINEAFEAACGCPLCALREKLENDSLEYIMGAAMMEPDVRIETNKTGFCRKHYDRMLGMKNRLGMALTMVSRMDLVRELLLSPDEGGKSLLGKKKSDGKNPLLRTAESCFVCRRVAGFEEKVLSNTLHLWKTDKTFREKLKNQPFFCLPHAGALLEQANASFSKNLYAEFRTALSEVCLDHLDRLRTSLSGFTASYDHRSAGKPITPEEQHAVEDTAVFLSGR